MAADADAHCHYEGNIQLRRSGADAYLTDWKNPNWGLEYALETPEPGRWTVTAEVAAPEATPLLLVSGKKKTRAPLAATGPDLKWQTVGLGTSDLPAGKATFGLHAFKQGWRELSVRRVWLTHEI